MPSKILVESRPLETRVALVHDNKLSEICFERNSQDALTGNIYIGRVENVVSGMDAAFVNIGLDKNAFLHYADLPDNLKKLKKPLKVGQELPVQITKLPGGEKGVRVSAELSIAGRMTVLKPASGGIGISKRIEDEEERKRLTAIAKKLVPDGMSLIIRTNAEHAEEDEIQQDISSLVSLWETLTKKLTHIKAPACIYKDHDAVYRCIRDLACEDTDEIIVEGESAFTSAMECARLFAPQLISKIQLYKSEIPLFSVYSIKKQLDEALSRRVWLRSGGFLVFDRTEALTVIDVNTGKYTGKSSHLETVFKINLEAAEEIARQIRLRDIGGIIIIDFIDMETRAQKDALIKTLREHLKKDKTHTNVLGITALGLVEMTRRKKREPIENALKCACPLCQSENAITNPECVALDIFSSLDRRFSAAPDKPLLVRASHRVTEACLNMHPDLMGRAYITTDDKIPGHEFTIEDAFENNLPPKTRKITGE